MRTESSLIQRLSALSASLPSDSLVDALSSALHTQQDLIHDFPECPEKLALSFYLSAVFFLDFKESRTLERWKRFLEYYLISLKNIMILQARFDLEVSA